MPPDRPALHVRRYPPAHPGAPRYLLVHGAMDRAGSFGRLRRELGGAEVVAYDRRGYAGSATVAPSEQLADQVEDLLEVVGDEPVVALGHSFGGALVLAAAARRPDRFRAAVVWEPPQPWRHAEGSGPPAGVGAEGSGPPAGMVNTARPAVADRSPADAAEAFMRRMAGDEVWEHLPEATRRQRRAEGRALLADLAALRGGVPWTPGEVSVPVVVGYGGQSLPRHREAAVALADELPDGCLRTIPGAGHGAHLSHPRELAALLDEAARLGRAGRGAAASTATGAHQEGDET